MMLALVEVNRVAQEIPQENFVMPRTVCANVRKMLTRVSKDKFAKMGYAVGAFFKGFDC